MYSQSLKCDFLKDSFYASPSHDVWFFIISDPHQFLHDILFCICRHFWNSYFFPSWINIRPNSIKNGFGLFKDHFVMFSYFFLVEGLSWSWDFFPNLGWGAPQQCSDMITQTPYPPPFTSHNFRYYMVQ